MLILSNASFSSLPVSHGIKRILPSAVRDREDYGMFHLVVYSGVCGEYEFATSQYADPGRSFSMFLVRQMKSLFRME